jgi:hypothetical protein
MTTPTSIRDMIIDFDTPKDWENMKKARKMER